MANYGKQEKLFTERLWVDTGQEGMVWIASCQGSVYLGVFLELDEVRPLIAQLQRWVTLNIKQSDMPDIRKDGKDDAR